METIKQNSNIEFEGIFTHFSIAFYDDKITKEQFEKFMNVVKFLEENNIKFKLKHACNSSAFVKFPEMHLDAVRVGSAFVGRLSVENKIGVKKIGTLESKVAEVRTLPANFNIGYSNIYLTKKETKVAIIPVGHSDGFNVSSRQDMFRKVDKLRYILNDIKRFFKKQYLKVNINNKNYKLAGRLGMYHSTVIVDENVKVGDKVLSGSINVEGLIEVKVTEKYENSTVSKVLQLVETATDRKAKTENFVSKAAKIYTPIVIGLAIIIAVFMPMVIKSVSYSESIYKALVFLVISCPCSIAISVPLSYFSGIGKSSKEGILVKGSDYLDGIKNIKEIIFDKTGTITTGKFEVVEVKTYGELNEEEVYKYFAYGEKFSNHPIAKSILEYKHIDIDESKVKNLKEISGKGISYEFEGKTIKIGNKELVEEKTNRENNGTALYLSVDGKVEGAIILKDKIKDNMKNTFEKFKKLGIKTRMFTGDRKEVAEEVTSEVGIDEYKAEMLPQDKFNELEKVIESNKDENYKVAFVGDGINDSPVIARADIGISMGGVGASSAIEASDVVIMTDEIEKIITGIHISKKTNRIIKENLVFSIGIKILVLLLTILGISDMWEAVFADVGVTLITIFNTLRILK